ncbi:MAG: flagellar protein export ATPase FliI [Gammaproteobacteria bacterium]|nr:flagellar protein export ATPase FliI [Gammaproteobacteria bacterium]
MSVSIPDADRSTQWRQRLAQRRDRLSSVPRLVVEGRLTRMVGLTLEAVGCQAAIGERCIITNGNGALIEAEVVGFAEEKLYLMPTTDIRGLMPNARVVPTGKVCDVAVGDKMLGRVISGSGEVLDGVAPFSIEARVPLVAKPVNPLQRQMVTEPLDVGVRAINALLSVGRGQRMGLFAGSGVGKSVLLGMMTRYTTADVIVVGLIGERGREVKDFITNTLGKKGMARAVVIAAPADNPPLMRLHGAMLATSVAEYFRDQGKHVLLLMDSLTRYAQAQREIALAIGEPPATKGYPPSVFAKLPQLVERAGNSGTGRGSMTAFYTVLTEGDDQQDPIADAARAILDGHVVLSRELAESGHYPAIDIEASISRIATEITTADQQQKVRRFKQRYSLYRQNRDLISVGAYTPGSDARIDEAIEYAPKLEQFLQQGMDQAVNFQNSQRELSAL